MKQNKEQKADSGSDIDWKYFFGGSSGRTFDRYYEAEINGKRVEKHTSNSGVEYSIGNMDKAKKKYKTEGELLAAVLESALGAANDIIMNYDPHEVSKVKCGLCNHTWVAVRPKGVLKLECPNCEEITDFENIPTK